MWHFPDAQFKYRSDVTREIRTLQQEYLRRAALQQRKPLEGKGTKTILEEALQLIKAHQDVKYRLQPHSYAPGQPQRFFVSDGSESKWLPAGDWEIKVFNVAQGPRSTMCLTSKGKGPSGFTTCSPRKDHSQIATRCCSQPLKRCWRQIGKANHQTHLECRRQWHHPLHLMAAQRLPTSFCHLTTLRPALKSKPCRLMGHSHGR